MMRKAPITIVVSVHPSVHMAQLSTRWMDFMTSNVWRFKKESVEEIQG